MKLKTKIITFALSFCLIIPSMFMLTACGDDEHTHSLTKIEAVAETCTTAGNTAYYKCDCGKYFSDEKAENEIKKDSWIKSATGHNLTGEYTYAIEGTKAYKVESCEHGDNVKTELTNYVVANTTDVLNKINSAEENAIVVLSAGNYSLLELKGVSFEDNITIVGVAGTNIDGVVISSGDDYHWGTPVAPQQVLAKGWTFEQIKFTDGIFVHNGIIEDFTVRDCNFVDGANIIMLPADISGDATGDYANETTSGLSKTYYAKNVVIEGNTFAETDDSAIYLQNVNNVTIRNNTINGTGFNGINISSERSAENASEYTKNLGTILIEGNTISNTGSRSVRMDSFDNTATLTVRNNILTNANVTESNSEVIKATKTNSSTVTFEGNTYNGNAIAVGNNITKS